MDSSILSYLYLPSGWAALWLVSANRTGFGWVRILDATEVTETSKRLLQTA